MEKVIFNYHVLFDDDPDPVPITIVIDTEKGQDHRDAVIKVARFASEKGHVIKIEEVNDYEDNS